MKYNITKELFACLSESDISYSVLRNFESLPDSCGGSDLDIFVAEKNVAQFYELLSQAASQTDSRLVSYTKDVLSPKICYLNVKGGIQIDVFKGGICCKGHVMIPEADIIANTILYNGVKVVEPHFGDLIGVLKEVLNNGKCKEKYIAPLRENASKFTETYLNEHLTVFSGAFNKLLADTISNNNYEKAFAKLQSLGLNDLGKTAKNGSSIFNKLSRLFHQPGYTIAVLGTDGSGKSFIINSITPILNEAFHNGVKYEHMRPNYLPSLAVALGKKRADEPATVCSNPHGSKPSGMLGSLLRLSYYWLDYTWGYFRKVFPDKAFKTHVWLFDRYYYDYYIDQRRARLNLPGWIIKAYGWFVPAPDLTICLGGDPTKIYARKPETSLTEVERQTKVLRDFASRHKRTVWVDTTVAPENSVNAAMRAIVDMMSKRFSR